VRPQAPKGRKKHRKMIRRENFMEKNIVGGGVPATKDVYNLYFIEGVM
jgi:hypothetical protein